MAMKCRVPPTGGPSRGLPETRGSFSILAFLILARPAAESVSPEMSGTIFDRLRMWPSLSTMPGFSRPGGPKRTSFMGGPLYSGLQACGRRIMRRPRAADKTLSRRSLSSPGREAPVWRLESRPVQSDQRRTVMPSVDVTPLRSPQRTIFGRYRTNNGQILILAGDAYDANDP